MNYVILDLEATCWDTWEKRHNETIEIGAVLVDNSGEIISEFCQFIRPIKHPILSEFCKNLTSIKQHDVDNAKYFSEVIEEFKEWFGFKRHDYLLCSWGLYDKKQFESDCLIHGLDSTWTENHINVKKEYGKLKNLRRAKGMKNALKMERIALEGTHHRGIDDAKNIAKIFIKYFDQWNIKRTPNTV